MVVNLQGFSSDDPHRTVDGSLPENRTVGFTVGFRVFGFRFRV